MTSLAVEIAYLDGPRLRRSLLAAADWVDASREELNRINVFPVPDGDTGTNFAMTLRAAAESVRSMHKAELPAVAKAMADACVMGARGNSGMLLSQFLLGFREALGDKRVAEASDVALALRQGADRLFSSLDEPVEGTILTVSREAAMAAEAAAEETENLHDLLQRVHKRSEVALEKTPEQLKVLKDAGVVDAGAKAFVRVLEGVVRLIQGDPIMPASATSEFEVPDIAALTEVDPDRDYRYCTEVLVRGTDLPASIDVRAKLRDFGGSIVVLATDELLKVHIHTESPQDIFDLAATWGAVETTKADDMREQHEDRHHPVHQRVAIVMDSSCDLPDRVLDAHGMVVVPLQIIDGEKTYLDRIDIRGGDLYTRMRENGDIFTTSQPTPGAFVRGFEDAQANSDQVLGIFIAGALSGTLNSAQAAARAMEPKGGITILDSRTASLGMGMLALRAVELAEAGWSVKEIVAELDRVRDRSGAFITVDTFDNLLRSGRVSRGRAWLGGLLDIKPILEVDQSGRVVPLDRVRGREALVPRVLEHMDARLTPLPSSLRLAVAHAGVPELAKELKAEMVRRYKPRDCLMTDVTAAIGVHVGPDAWGVFYQIEDPAPLDT